MASVNGEAAKWTDRLYGTVCNVKKSCEIFKEKKPELAKKYVDLVNNTIHIPCYKEKDVQPSVRTLRDGDSVMIQFKDSIKSKC